MVEVPDGYTIRRKFWVLLPEEITINIGRSKAVSAEATSLNDLVKFAVEMEEAMRVEQITKRIKMGGPMFENGAGASSHNDSFVGRTGAGNGDSFIGRPTVGGKVNPKQGTHDTKDLRPNTSSTNPSSGNSKQSPDKRTSVVTRTTGDKGKDSFSSSSQPTCYRCGGHHYANEGKCPPNSGTATIAVRRM